MSNSNYVIFDELSKIKFDKIRRSMDDRIAKINEELERAFFSDSIQTTETWWRNAPSYKHEFDALQYTFNYTANCIKKPEPIEDIQDVDFD